MTADKFAVGLSIACALHCLLLPVALTALPAIASLPIGEESFHLWMLLGVIPISVFAMTLGCRQHRDPAVAGASIAGLGVLLFAAIFGHDVVGEAGEKILTVMGSAVLVFAHTRNFRLCHKQDCCTEDA